MFGIGAITRCVKGFVEGRDLDVRINSLQQLANFDPVDLVPAVYRPCSSLHLALAEWKSVPSSNTDAGRKLLKAFEEVRMKNIEMLERHNIEAATKGELATIVQSMDDLARALHADVEKVND
jgi:hypothetical protein